LRASVCATVVFPVPGNPPKAINISNAPYIGRLLSRM